MMGCRQISAARWRLCASYRKQLSFSVRYNANVMISFKFIINTTSFTASPESRYMWLTIQFLCESPVFNVYIPFYDSMGVLFSAYSPHHNPCFTMLVEKREQWHSCTVGKSGAREVRDEKEVRQIRIQRKAPAVQKVGEQLGFELYDCNR